MTQPARVKKKRKMEKKQEKRAAQTVRPPLQKKMADQKRKPATGFGQTLGRRVDWRAGTDRGPGMRIEKLKKRMMQSQKDWSLHCTKVTLSWSECDILDKLHGDVCWICQTACKANCILLVAGEKGGVVESWRGGGLGWGRGGGGC